MRFFPVWTGSREGPFPASAEKAPPQDVYRMELADEDGRVLKRGPLQVHDAPMCDGRPGASRRVTGAIAWVEGAASLALSEHGVAFAKLAVGKTPSVKLAWRTTSAVRGRRYRLGLDLSEPAPGAIVRVLHEWRPGRRRVLAVTRPTDEIALVLGDVPGGRSCRIVVEYASGLRTAVVSTPRFELAKLAPALEITRPADGAVFAPWHAVECEGTGADEEGRTVPADSLLWTIDGKPAGTGWAACARGLAEGKHVVTLHLAGSDVVVRRSIVVRAPKRVAARKPS
jgi:hypothetical protein